MLMHVTRYDVNETGECCARLEKLNTKDCILHGSVDMKCP